MKRFIRKTLLLVLPLLLMSVFMEVLLRNIPNDYQKKRLYLDAHANEIETLILGNSHSLAGLDPSYFDTKTFNAAHVSQSLNYDLAILNKYVDRLDSLKTIILSISYFSLYETLESSLETWRIKNYNIYYDIHLSKSLKNYSEVLSLRLHTNLKRIVDYYVLRKSSITCTDLGWGKTRLSKDAQNLLETGLRAANFHTITDINEKEFQIIYQENLHYLNEILAWSLDNDVMVLLISFPVYKTYINQLNKDQLKSTIRTAEEISEQYVNCIYLNLMEDSMFYAKDFYDADHLSELGAKKMSFIVNQIIDDLH